MVLKTGKHGRCVGGSCKSNGKTVGKIFAELSKGNSKSDASESNGETIEVPREYRKQAIVSDVLKHGLLTYQGLADGTVSIKTFFRAKRQAQFMDWLTQQVVRRNTKDEVEYFD